MNLWRAWFAVEVARLAPVYGFGRLSPAVVVSQAFLETGGFRSAIFLESRNPFGLKVPARRPTLAVGTARGHAVFSCYGDAVSEYFARQRGWSAIRGAGTDDAYMLATVASGYATDPGYLVKWRALLVARAGMPGAPVLALPLALSLAYVRH